MPLKVYIPHRYPNEEAHMILRRHWIVFVPKFFILIFMLAIPPAAYMLTVQMFGFTFPFDSWVTVIAVMLASVFYLFTWLLIYHDWVDYYLDVWIITNKRILDIEQHGLFSRVISELSIENVQEATNKVKGFLATFLNYGDVHVQSAGAEKTVIFNGIPHPVETAQIIIRLSQEAQKERDMALRNNGAGMADEATQPEVPVTEPLAPADPATVAPPENEIDFMDRHEGRNDNHPDDRPA